jgi:serine/threonine-protein kinase
MAPFSSPDRWKRLDDLFNRALDLEAAQRREFLAEACGADLELREEVESLLRSADEPADFIEQPLAKAAHDLRMRSGQEALAAGSRFGRYAIVSLVGAGGMGQVYLAVDTRLGRKAALKTLTPEFVHDERGLQRFEQEARAASALNHPNILTIYEVGQSGETHFIASEFIDGPNLRERLAAGRLDMESVLDIAIQIAAGLNAAHAVGIAHRDIKPENVMVRKDGLVKLVDFGIAKLNEVSGTEGAPALPAPATRLGMVVGTAKYMSPEQARGLAVDGRSDLFSLGTVLYEMAAGRAPFEGATHSDVIAEILKGEPRPLEDVSPDAPRELCGIVAKVLRKDRERRYQSAGEMLADLRAVKRALEYRAHAQASMPFRGYIQHATSPGRMRARLRMALAGLVLAAASGGYFLWRHAGRAPAAPRTLAILPFRNIRQDPATDFLGFSLADAVITKLGYVGSLTLRPSSSIERYRNQTLDLRQVGAELNVNTLLTGSFLKDGDDLRINTQLVDLTPLRMIWQDTIDIKYEKLLSVQDRVAQQIIDGLELSLRPVEAENLKFDNPISRSAYERYLRGVDFYASNDFASAIEALEQSAAMEPNYALTWAHLGRPYTTSAGLQFGGREQYRRAQAAYERALQLNPALIETRVYMANLFTDTGRAEEAVPLLRAALQGNPNIAEAHWELGYAYRFGGMLPESVRECELARRLDPEVKINSSALNSYLYLGEYDRFLANLPEADTVYILFYLGFAEYYKGDYAQAAARFDRAFEMDPSLLQAQIGKALAYALRRQKAEGVRLLRAAESKFQERGAPDGEGMYKVSQAYAVLGDRQSALRMLRHSIDGGFYCYPYFQSDPLMSGLRGDASFEGLMEEARRKHERFQAKFVNAIYALAGAGTTSSNLGTGTVVVQDNIHLHGPLDVVLAPNGHLLVANSDGSNVDLNQPSELVEYTTAGQFVSQFSLDPNNGGAFGLNVSTVGWNTVRVAAVDDNANTLKLWTSVLQ